MRRWTVYVVAAATAVTLSACHGSNATGPAAPSVTGNWTYSASNVSGSGLACDISGVAMGLQQSGNTFTGSLTGGTLSCTASGQTSTQSLGSDVVANGTIVGNTVAFDIGTSDIHDAGTISGNSMSGTVTIRLDLGAPTGVITLSGNFAAVRQ